MRSVVKHGPFDFAAEIRIGLREQSGAIGGFALEGGTIQVFRLTPSVESRGHVG
jgi:hypothetical protein